jgi:hypothetical protein
MSYRYNGCSLLLLLCVLLPVTTNAGELVVSQGYVRATPPGVSSSAAYLTLLNETGKRRVLVAVTSDRAKQVMMHQNQWQGDMMQMRHVSQLEIAPGAHFDFEPGGYHLMLTGLAQPLVAGERVLLKFAFQRGDTYEVSLPVLDVGAAMDMKGQH